MTATPIRYCTSNGMPCGKEVEYESERELHELIKRDPGVLQIAGSDDWTILGRRVRLGTARASLLAVEPTGRPVVIEARLWSNLNKVQSIVSHTLRHAAFLRGLDLSNLQGKLKGKYVLDELEANAGVSLQTLERHLNRGDFRLVMVVDGPSAALTKIVAYTNSFMTDEISIDLVSIPLREIDGARVAFPQLADLKLDFPERVEPSADQDDDEVEDSLNVEAVGGGWIWHRSTPDSSYGLDKALSWITKNLPNKAATNRIIDWVQTLPDVRLNSKIKEGASYCQLYPISRQHGRSLFYIAFYPSGPRVYAYRKRFMWYAPESIEDAENAASVKLGWGTRIRPLNEKVLEALRGAYVEASQNLDADSDEDDD